MNIKLLRPADFSERLREHGVDKKFFVQKMCNLCRDENDLRSANKSYSVKEAIYCSSSIMCLAFSNIHAAVFLSGVLMPCTTAFLI